MAYGDGSDRETLKQRRWYQRRAITRKTLAEPSRLAVDTMQAPVLWASLHAELYRLQDRIADGSDVEMARAFVNARAIVNELELRGVQLEFVLPD